MRDLVRRWAPAALLTAGALITRGLEPRGGVSLREPLGAAVPLLLVCGAVAVTAVTLPLSGVHVPGQRTLQALLDRVPQPWK